MKLTIGQKIILGYGLALLFMVGFGLASYRSIESLVVNDFWVAHTQTVLGETASIVTTLADAEDATRGYLLTGEQSYLDEPFRALETLPVHTRAIRELTMDNPSQQRRLDSLEPLVERKIAAMRETVEARKKQPSSAGIGIDKGHELMAGVRNVLTAMVNEEDRLKLIRDRQATESAQNTTRVILYGSLLALLAITGVGIAIHRSITRPLTEFQHFVTAVGEGDLSQKSAREGRDEVGRLAHGLNQMVERLKEMASQTRAGVEHLNAATAEILASASQQAAGTGEQAAACQETNAAMQQVSQSCLQITEKARQVATTSEMVASANSSSVDAVQKAIQTVDSIREQAEAVAENVMSLSEKTQIVGEIIATVNDIAEQSHLLALNAAIEAAAAGEHGRSFAVVAGEIKNLADQSKDATVQVKTILGDIQKGIGTSVMLTEEAVKRADLGKQRAGVAATAIRELTGSIELSVQAFQQIVAGSNQQQISFEHVMQAVKDIGRSSDQTANGTRQMEKAAANLTVLGQQLRKSTDRYRL